MYCQNCGHAFQDGESFCPHCGAAASAKSAAPIDVKQIKADAKEAFRRMYWPTVIITLVAAALLLFGNGPAILLFIFAGLPLLVGIAKARLMLSSGETVHADDVVSGFSDYKKNTLTMLLVFLFIMLGFVCLFVPGVIVAIGLFGVKYRLAEGTPLSGMDLIRSCWDEMKGHKRELFKLVLSFFGWFVLSVLTLGAVGIFYALPWYSLASAGFYRALRAGRTDA